MGLSSFSTVLHAIFAEGADYTKKSVESRLAVVEKLLGAKSLETVIQIQSEYAKRSYAAFVAQATKMGELHSNLAKAVFKPAELAIATMQGSGIGAAVAERLARDGFTVVINYSGDATPAEALARKIEDRGGRALTAKADVSNPQAVRGMFDAAEAAFGGVDVRVNNAGIIDPSRKHYDV
jgi:Enoyl-(Acyl carrier protein) reductase/Phasin protein